MDVRLREGGDEGKPIVTAHPDSPAAKTFNEIADSLIEQKESLVGKPLGLNVD